MHLLYEFAPPNNEFERTAHRLRPRSRKILALNDEIAVPPLHGTLVAVEPGVWRYTPDAEFSGTDGLRFTASDGVFRPQPVGLTLVGEPVNDAPPP